MLGSKQNICITFLQRRPNVFDAGTTLYKCYTNVLCLLGYDNETTLHYKYADLHFQLQYVLRFLFFRRLKVGPRTERVKIMSHLFN